MEFQETVFAQLIHFVDHNEFRRCVKRYNGDHRSRSFSCWDLFLCLVFALSRMRQKLYHMGIRGTLSKSTLADALSARDWRIYKDFATSLMPKALELYKNDPIDPEVKNTVYAFDSTTIDLCLSVFGWANFRKTKAGIKLHTLLNLRGAIPVQVKITDAKGNDVHAMDELEPEKDAIYLFDRAYVDFERLYRFEESGACFVTRSKRSIRMERRYSHFVDKSTGIQCDQTVILQLKKRPIATQNHYAA